MVSLGSFEWAWPLCAALGLSAWQAWPVEKRGFAVLSLGLALASACAPSAAWAFAGALLALMAAGSFEEPGAWLGSVGFVTLLAALLRLRIEWLPALPEAMAFWAGLAALTGACLAGQGLLAAQTPGGIALSLVAGQAAWACFGLVTGSPSAPLAWVGFLSLLWQQALLRAPLESLLRRPTAPPALVTALLFLGLGGCLGFSGFSAYFELFVPLMGQGEGVADMHAKLFSGAGLLAAVAMLAVLVQTSAFGYFYWQRILPLQASTEPRPWSAKVWPWLALALSLYWGLHANAVSRQALDALRAAGPMLSTPQP